MRLTTPQLTNGLYTTSESFQLVYMNSFEMRYWDVCHIYTIFMYVVMHHRLHHFVKVKTRNLLSIPMKHIAQSLFRFNTTLIPTARACDYPILELLNWSMLVCVHWPFNLSFTYTSHNIIRHFYSHHNCNENLATNFAKFTISKIVYTFNNLIRQYDTVYSWLFQGI